MIRHKLIRIAAPSFLVCSLVLLGLMMMPKIAHAAQSSDTYSPGPNDVATQGPNASIDAPTSNFKVVIKNNNADVLIRDACVDRTAGSRMCVLRSGLTHAVFQGPMAMMVITME
jgi:hypothetical protein